MERQTFQHAGIVWLAHRGLTGSSLSLKRMILTPGHSGETHRHPNADEVIYVVRGRVEVRAGVETFPLERCRVNRRLFDW
jgi:quercetin dioxygenase-like cupin family protein